MSDTTPKTAKAPAAKLTKTKYPGVYELTHNDGDVTYYAMFRRGRKQVKDKIGKKSEGWSAEAASRERALRKKGTHETTAERKQREKAEEEAKANRWTFDHLLARYCEVKADLKSLNFEVLRYRNHLQAEFGGLEPSALTSLDVQRLRNRLKKNHLKPASVRHAVELLRRLANFGVKQGLCAGLGFQIELQKLNNTKTEELSPEQLRTLQEVLRVESALGNPAAFMVRLVLATGMRRGEIFRLRWSDLRDGHILLREPKGGMDATIPLNDATRRILDEVPRSDFPLVFPGRDGKVRTNAHKSLTRIKTLAALPDDFRILHGCRHVFASTGVSNGIDLYTMQHLLTHKSPAMTQRYAHLADDHLKRASERTARILAGGNMESVIDLGGNRQKRQA
jgi:integrase